MTPCAIRLDKVRRIYAGAAVLEDATLTAPQGEVLALLGASGSGKSTILRLIAGLEPVDSGEIHLGEALASARGRTLPAEARHVGMVFQDYALFPHLTVERNVAFGLAHMAPEARAAEAGQWLARVGLAHRSKAFPHELSGGEQQRVALARALAPRPRAILLDEPFSGLDPALRAELRDLTLAAVRDIGATTVFVTHDAEEAMQIADRLAILQKGRVLQEGAPREVYDKPVSRDAAAALGPINWCEGRVERGMVETPFGPIAAPGLAEGAAAQAVVRAEALVLAPGRGARVVERRTLGAQDLVTVESGGVRWRALVSPRAALGEEAAAALQPSGAFAFSI